MSGYVYILKGELNRFYVGSTDDIERRLKQHRSGTTPTTRNMGKFDVVLIQEYPNLKIARKIEFKIKKLKRKDYLEKMIQSQKIEMTV